MKDYFLKIYTYNVWANKKVINTLKKQQVVDKKILTLMSHVLSALHIWLARIENRSTEPYPLWHMYDIDQLEDMADDIGARWLLYIERNEKFDGVLIYKNYVGLPYENKIENIMIHLVNHSTYHRAQIATLLRQAGLEPINTDFITYDRVLTGQLKDE
ncbi:MAG: hypothetical protein O9302_04720 [Cyclobacteriaceae bacterium]|jgi:uncharacterized damage-inducible protein DinB|nr:hypothetical protein [Cytophagales bacterium]MCZ8327338.1 hypothetical protein [Cyclobacteriaceae bacterium]